MWKRVWPRPGRTVGGADGSERWISDLDFQNVMCTPMVMARFPPMVPVAEPKLAALLGQVVLPWMKYGALQEPRLFRFSGTSRGALVALPVPVVWGIWSRLCRAVCWSVGSGLVTIWA